MTKKLELTQKALRFGRRAQAAKQYTIANFCFGLALDLSDPEYYCDAVARKISIISRPGNTIEDFRDLLSAGYSDLYYALVNLEVGGENMNIPLPLLNSISMIEILNEIEDFRIEARADDFDLLFPGNPISNIEIAEFIAECRESLGLIFSAHAFDGETAEKIRALLEEYA